MFPAITDSPPNFFTPNLRPAESRPFLELPPAFLCAMLCSPQSQSFFFAVAFLGAAAFFAVVVFAAAFLAVGFASALAAAFLAGATAFLAAGFDFDIAPLLKSWGLDHRIHDRIAMLSGGQRRKVALLCGLIPAMISNEPVAVLLDEADSGLDDDSTEKLAKTLRDLAAGGHAILISSHDSRIISASDRIIRFPFEEEQGDAKSGKFTPLEKAAKRSVNIGHRLNLRTLSGLANNGIAGLLTLGAMLALLDPSQLEGRMLTAFVLAPALTAGLCGNPIHKLSLENRAYAWWNTKSAIPQNAIFHSVLLCGGLTLLASTITSDLNWELIIAGAILGATTEAVVGLLSNATLRLARPNAVMIRLLTPILILPWALLVDTLTA